MSDFIQQILLRHNSAVPTVQPLLRGKFEPLPEAMRSQWNNSAGSDFPEQVDKDRSLDAPNEATAPWPEPSLTRIGASNGQNTGNFAERPPSTRLHDVFSDDRLTQPSDHEEKPDVQAPDLERMGTPSASKPDAFSPIKISLVDEQNAKPWQQRLLQDEMQVPKVMPILATQIHQEKEPYLPAKLTFQQTMEQRKNTVADMQSKVSIEGSLTSVIKVSIGRIEVRAVMQQTNPPTAKNAEIPRPTMSLEDYLKKRNDSTR